MPKMTSANGESLQALLSDPAVHVFAWKSVIIFVWNGDATVELIRLLGKVVETKVREVGRVSTVNLVGTLPALPDEEQRQAYKGFSAALSGKLVHAAIVLEGTGFMISAVRALITSLSLVSRQEYSVGVVHSFDEVAQSLPAKHAAGTGVELDPVALREVLVQARTQALGAPHP